MFDPKVMFEKGLKGLLIGAVSVALSAVLAYLANGEAVKAALEAGGASAAVIAFATPIITGGALMLLNWWKNGNK